MSSSTVIESSPWGYQGPWSFAPIALEFCTASLVYLCLIDKGTPKGNFPMLIVYSVLKLLAIAAVFTSNMNFLGVANLPFLLGLLVNEVVLLILGIQIRSSLRCVVLRKLYSRSLLFLRNVSELLFIFVLVGVAFISPLYLSCSCPIRVQVIFGEYFAFCQWRPTPDRIAKVLTPQLRGISFAVSVLAGLVSVGGVREIAGSLVRYAVKEIPTPGRAPVPIMDPGWKKVIRAVYCWLGLVTVALFALAYFTPGMANCAAEDCTLKTAKDSAGNSKNYAICNRVTYTLGPITSILINAMVAISQMFVFDMLQKTRETESMALDSKSASPASSDHLA